MTPVEHVGATEPGAEEAIADYNRVNQAHVCRANPDDDDLEIISEMCIVKLEDGRIVWAECAIAARIVLGIATAAVLVQEGDRKLEVWLPLYKIWRQHQPTPPWIAPQLINVAGVVP